MIEFTIVEVIFFICFYDNYYENFGFNQLTMRGNLIIVV
jgi:hypothetical protein